MSASYLDPDELPDYYDLNRILDLATDDGEKALEADLSDDSSDAYRIVLTQIRRAASDLDSHCQQGKRYTRAVLEQIIADAQAAPANEGLQKRAAIIRSLVADLAFGMLVSRRGHSADTLQKLAPRYESALITLERLAQGVLVFDIDGAIQRGAPSTVRIGSRQYRPSLFNRMFGVFEDTPGIYGGQGGTYFPGFFGRW